MGLETAAIIAAVAAAAPAIYGIGKDILGPGTSNIDAAGAKKLGDMQKAASAYGAYRPDQADARMKAMSQQLSAYQGAGNMMQAMYGGSGGGGAGGTYTPGGGGYKSPDPNTASPGVGPGTPWATQADYDAWKKWYDAQEAEKVRVMKTDPGADPNHRTPPIYIPPTSGGIGAGTSGPMLTGPMAQSLVPQDPTLLNTNPMAASLAGKTRY